jgi:hypothetical protein
MPTLDWIGKDAAIRRHREVPFRLLEPDETLSHGDPAEGNLIVRGGNILTEPILDGLPNHDAPKTIYAAATRLGSAALQRASIVFKQTPYAIEV